MVTFETKCWQNDFKLMLKTRHLEHMINNCNCKFAAKQLIINNVNDEEAVLFYADKHVKSGTLTDVYLASEYSDKVLKAYGIDRSSFGGGSYYSIAELTGIYCCKTKYLLHFSSDSYIPKEFAQSSWIQDAIDLMEKRPEIIVANPVWNYKYDEALAESKEVVGNFYIGQGFSDQCYLINTEIFKDRIYNFSHPDSERYPKYGGNLFEKRVDAYMRTHNKLRITAKDVSYISKNIKKWDYWLEKTGIKNIAK